MEINEKINANIKLGDRRSNMEMFFNDRMNENYFQSVQYIVNCQIIPGKRLINDEKPNRY